MNADEEAAVTDDRVLAELLRRFLGDDFDTHWSHYAHYAPPGQAPTKFTLIIDGQITITREELDAVKRASPR